MLKKLGIFSITTVLFSIYLHSSSREGKVVETKSGIVKGVISWSRGGREFHEWLGIPYAQPPVGNLRFASPVPIEKWTGVLDGSQYGHSCIQLELITLFSFGREDCLTLNIHSPKHANNTKLPVMVYIHGGGYNLMGSVDYKPHFFMDEDIVLVVINYRLGIFGFLSTGDQSIRGNMGLKDQALALKWVKNNIEYFGGDSGQITIFGESAGAASVHYQLLSPTTEGLFQRAISLSGVATNPWSYDTTEVARKRTEDFARKVNCPIHDSQELANCLRDRSSRELITAGLDDLTTFSMLLPHKSGTLFRPTVEAGNDSETFLAQDPLDVVKQGKAHRVPWITGVTGDEGLITSSCFYSKPETVESYESKWEENTLRAFGIPSKFPNATKISKKLREYYLQSNSTVAITKSKMLQFTEIKTGGFSLRSLYFALTQTSNQFLPVKIFNVLNHFFQTFLNKLGFGYDPIPKGTAHADDLLLMFPFPMVSLLSKDAAEDFEFSKDFIKLWAAFAKNEPMQFRGQQFLPIGKTGPLKYLELNDSPQLVEDPFLDRMTFLESLNFIK
ncbi:unnamed protein product [Allacma fusca]|uniref:Carboxylic ester hydrolase n=1 Tax=Allacma fusca TaxID=39272 RepID=A0A8J2PWG5_9HEXA|nr:unnamed protein product [Allacma fusca]